MSIQTTYGTHPTSFPNPIRSPNTALLQRHYELRECHQQLCEQRALAKRTVQVLFFSFLIFFFLLGTFSFETFSRWTHFLPIHSHLGAYLPRGSGERVPQKRSRHPQQRNLSTQARAQSAWICHQKRFKQPTAQYKRGPAGSWSGWNSSRDLSCSCWSTLFEPNPPSEWLPKGFRYICFPLSPFFLELTYLTLTKSVLTYRGFADPRKVFRELVSGFDKYDENSTEKLR